MQFVTWSSDENAEAAYRILEKLPIRTFAASELLGTVLEALIPHQRPQSPPPRELVKRVLLELVEIPEIDLEHSRSWDLLSRSYPREVYEFVRARIILRGPEWEPGFAPIPRSHRSRFRLPALRSDPTYPEICRELWTRALALDGGAHAAWVKLFKGVVLEAEEEMWMPRFSAEIRAANSAKELINLVEIIRFEGSLMIFRYPELTKAFLKRASELGIFDDFEWRLLAASGPQVRAYSDGKLDPDDDYVLAEAVKAAESNAADPILGRFYRWAVKVEEKDRSSRAAAIEADSR